MFMTGVLCTVYGAQVYLLFERAYLKLLNSNKIALYKSETIIYLRFSIF